MTQVKRPSACATPPCPVNHIISRVDHYRYFSYLDPVHTRPAKLENRAFTLKTHKMLSVDTTPGKLENATITGHFGFVFEENSVREIS